MTVDQDDTRAIRDQILENQGVIDELNAKLARKSEEVRIIQQISSEINATLDLEKILELILASMDAVLGFRNAMVLLADSDDERVTLAASRGYADGHAGAHVKFGQGVIGVSAKRQRIMRMGNIQSQMTYLAAVRARAEAAGQPAGQVEEIRLPGLEGVQSQIAIPLLVQDRLVGVFAVESVTPNAFDEIDEVLLSIVSNQVASAIDNARLHQAEMERTQQLDQAVAELSKLNETLEGNVAERTKALTQALEEVSREKKLSESLLSRMAPPEVIPLMLEDKLAPGKIATTILFLDLENFTGFSAGMEPDEIFSRLNHFFSWAGGIITRYRGYINKTNGDGLMALFGVPYESRSHATDAVLAALNLQRELRDHFPLNMRVGINSGAVTAGMLGPKNKSLYDVLGDPVNIASRMEAICPSGGITLSRDTYNLVKPYFDITAMGEREVKGLRLVECFQATGVVGLAADARRVDPTSRFAALAPALVARIEAIKTEHLGAIDFLSIQARDGALGHNEAVAAYALGLLGALKDGLGGFTVEGADAVDEDALVALALAHDIGKFAIEPARLNDPALSGPAIDSLRDDLAAKTVEALATLERESLAPSVEALVAFERTGGIAADIDLASEIVVAADIYDAMAAPKLYKGAPWRITGILEEILRLPYCQGTMRPVFQAFAELMKPKDAPMPTRGATKVLIQ